MARIVVHGDTISSSPLGGGRTQKLINTAVSTWHAAFPGGAAVAVTTAFTDPSAAEADRIPELALAGGGTPGSYVLIGTWNSVDQTETIGPTVAGATVKGDLPFDTITSITGPDPVANLTLNRGDSHFDPPTRALWTGSTAGNISVQLSGETAVKTIALPSWRDWPRDVVRVGVTITTLTAPMAVW